MPRIHSGRRVGDYVVVHVGFAIQRLDEESALRTLAEFEHLGVLNEEFGDGFALAPPDRPDTRSHQFGIPYDDPEVTS